jgi:hypothetical protein
MRTMAATSPSESLKILLSQMFRDELGHLEHTHLALTIEYRPEVVVRVDHGSFLFILTTVPLNVVPKLFRKLGTW